MSTVASSSSRLLPTAGLVSLLALLLSATGLFALSYTHEKSVAALERLGWLHAAQVDAVKAQVAFKTQVQEWKNILLRGADPKDHQAYFSRFEQRETEVRAGLVELQGELKRLGLDAAGAERLVEAHTALGASYRTALAKYQPGDRDSAFEVDASIRGIDRQLNEDIDALANSVHEATENNLADFRASGAARYATLRKITLGLAAFTVLVAFWLVFQTARSSVVRTA